MVSDHNVGHNMLLKFLQALYSLSTPFFVQIYVSYIKLDYIMLVDKNIIMMLGGYHWGETTQDSSSVALPKLYSLPS